MPIISKGGRKSLKVRLIFAAIYTILVVGTITMAYPFMLMLSSSIASPFDFDDLRIIPKYLTSDDALVKKYLYAKYGQANFRELGIIYRRDADWLTWSSLREEKDFIAQNYPEISQRYSVNPQGCNKEIADWNCFKKTLSPQDITSFFPDNYDTYRNFLKNKYQLDVPDSSNSSESLARLNERWQRAFNSFAEILPLKSFLTDQRWFAPIRPDFDDLIAYHHQLPASKVKVIPTRLLWTLYLEKRFVNTYKFGKQTGIKVKQFSDVPIPTKNDKKLYPLWHDFLLKKYPLRLVTINGKYAPKIPIERMKWLDFVLTKIPIDKWNLNRPVELYQAFLKKKYQNIATLNSAYATTYKILNI